MRIKTRLIRLTVEERWTPEAIAGLVGQHPRLNGSESTVVEAEEVDGWIVATLDVPDSVDYRPEWDR